METNLLLPGNGDATGGELEVEVGVGFFEGNPLDGGKLLDVQHVFGVHRVRLFAWEILKINKYKFV